MISSENPYLSDIPQAQPTLPTHGCPRLAKHHTVSTMNKIFPTPRHAQHRMEITPRSGLRKLPLDHTNKTLMNYKRGVKIACFSCILIGECYFRVPRSQPYGLGERYHFAGAKGEG